MVRGEREREKICLIGSLLRSFLFLGLNRKVQCFYRITSVEETFDLTSMLETTGKHKLERKEKKKNP